MIFFPDFYLIISFQMANLTSFKIGCKTYHGELKPVQRHTKDGNVFHWCFSIEFSRKDGKWIKNEMTEKKHKSVSKKKKKLLTIPNNVKIEDVCFQSSENNCTIVITSMSDKEYIPYSLEADVKPAKREDNNK